MRRPTRRTLVWAVALIVWFVVGAVWAFLPPAGAVVGEHWGALAIFAMLAGLFALAEIFVVHVQFRRDAHSFSLLEVPLVVGLVFAPPGTVVLAVVVAGAVVLALHRRQSVIKLCFNVGVYALEVTLALLLFSALAGEASSIGLRVVVAAALAALCESAVGILLVFIAISISEASLRLSELARSLQFGLLTSGFATGLGLTAAILLEDKPAMVWLMLIPTAGIHLASWAYASERRRHEDLEFLYESTRLLHQSPELDAAVSALLHQARDAFRCDIAEVLLLGAAGDHLERAVVGPADQVELFAPIPADPFSRSWLARAHSGPWIATTDDSDEALPYLGQRGFHDAIAAPLTRDGRVTGVLTLANRQSEVTGFHNEDLRVAGTLANHISVALENGRLEVSLEQLRVLERRMHHQAHHDALTGLANRSLFHDLVTDALAEHGADHVAALFIDLDDFKTVNDTLGHAAGDELLVAVSRRLDACLEPGDVAARLGGDEFAVLVVTSSCSSERARNVATRVLEVLNEPVDIDGHRLPVYASIGLAVSDSQTDVAALLRNADTAMYTAKARGKRCVEVFDADMRAAVLSRYSVTYEIERAVAEHELVAYFQPLINLADHTVIGAETLVRWQHPTRGLLPPDQFIGIAEQSDAIFQVDKCMLELACQWLADWDGAQHEQPTLVTVNLTARDLRQPELPELVRTTLERHHLQPSRLVLEVTESLAMQDQQAAIEMMSQLKEIGVLIALDDFGTGYSSLSQLRDLPVDIVKMARPFVDNLSNAPGQTAFAEAIVTLAQILGKTVIAEGIEGPEQLGILAELGCDIGQGYHFAQPMDADSFRRWYEHWRTGRLRSTSGRASNLIALSA